MHPISQRSAFADCGGTEGVVYLFHHDDKTDDDAGGNGRHGLRGGETAAGDKGFTVRGKPAQDVMRRHYSAQ